jgi:uncharacterized protein YdiU (UPF0061 family)
VLADNDDTLIAQSYYDPQTRPSAATQAWLEKYRARCALDGVSAQVRREQMNATNPLYVPRNWLAQEAIDAAAAGNLEVLRTWLQVLRAPYTQQEGAEHFAKRRPEWARHKVGCSQLSCSS